MSDENPHALDERYVWFRLVGEFEPDDITALTGLTPDHAFRKGTRPRPRASVRKVSGWVVDSRLTPADEFHDHLTDLIALLRPCWDTLRSLGRTHQAFVGAAIYCHWSQGPMIQVSPEHSASLADLGATLEFDIYALPEEAPDDDGPRLLTRDELAQLDASLREG